ncbi:MAG: CHAD domain-containing protein [Halonotius sp.]
MEYTIQRGEPVAAEIRRIIDGKVQQGIDHIDDDIGQNKTVHEVRKRCKEVRAAARLVRPVLPNYSEVNAHYRDAARRISDIRDAHAAIETFDDHIQPAIEDSRTLSEAQIEDIRTTLVTRRDDMAASQDVSHRLDDVREDLVAGRERISDLPIATDGYDAVAGGLRKSYKRARNRMAEAYDDPDFERFHEWRKRIKYHRYHSRLLRSIWIGPMKARRAELNTLSDVIGDENDLAEFAMMMNDEDLFDAETGQLIDRIIRGRRSALHREGRPLGERLFAETPEQLIDRFGQYWEATREYDI